MPDRIFIDTNVLVYAYDTSARKKHEIPYANTVSCDQFSFMGVPAAACGKRLVHLAINPIEQARAVKATRLLAAPLVALAQPAFIQLNNVRPP